jgi:hypothetical protein
MFFSRRLCAPDTEGSGAVASRAYIASDGRCAMRAAFDAPIQVSAADLERILVAGPPALIVFETPDCDPCVALARRSRSWHGVRRPRARDPGSESAEGWLAARYNLTCVPTLSSGEPAPSGARPRQPGGGAIRGHLEYLVTGESLPTTPKAAATRSRPSSAAPRAAPLAPSAHELAPHAATPIAGSISRGVHGRPSAVCYRFARSCWRRRGACCSKAAARCRSSRATSTSCCCSSSAATRWWDGG